MNEKIAKRVLTFLGLNISASMVYGGIPPKLRHKIVAPEKVKALHGLNQGNPTGLKDVHPKLRHKWGFCRRNNTPLKFHIHNQHVNNQRNVQANTLLKTLLGLNGVKNISSQWNTTKNQKEKYAIDILFFKSIMKDDIQDGIQGLLLFEKCVLAEQERNPESWREEVCSYFNFDKIILPLEEIVQSLQGSSPELVNVLLREKEFLFLIQLIGKNRENIHCVLESRKENILDSDLFDFSDSFRWRSIILLLQKL